jgi:hypothetical protein
LDVLFLALGLTDFFMMLGRMAAKHAAEKCGGGKHRIPTEVQQAV